MTINGRVSAWLLGLFKWRVVFAPPPVPKAVVIVYPHTSNWDFVIGVLARSVMNLRMHWVGKHTLFKWPFGTLMRLLGGVPVDRAHTSGLVDQLRGEFDRYTQFYLTITPEGTRQRAAYWRSGFYYLALGLHMPVGLAFIDYGKREVGVLKWLTLSGH